MEKDSGGVCDGTVAFGMGFKTCREVFIVKVVGSVVISINCQSKY